MDGFTVTHLDKFFLIDGIITAHYFEFGKNYMFTGEEHDFWELVYVDKGVADAFADDKWREIECGNLVFHRPMQYHNLRANGVVAPNVAILTFVCNSKSMNFFDNKIIRASKEEKDLIGRIISLAQRAFTTPLDDLFTKSLIKSGDTASEQLLGLYIEELLLSLYTRCNREKPIKTEHDKNGSTALAAVNYMDAHINEQLCVSAIASALMKSESELKRAFKKETGFGVMTYFRNMKVNHAKQMLRQADMNITEISEKLGYDNIHHFSKQFKTITGMSPREYGRSIKSRLDGNITKLSCPPPHKKAGST